MQVGNKWVSSLAVRLPAAGVELLQLREGDSIDIVVDGSRELAVCKQEGVEGMMKRFAEGCRQISISVVKRPMDIWAIPASDVPLCALKTFSN